MTGHTRFGVRIPTLLVCLISSLTLLAGCIGRLPSAPIPATDNVPATSTTGDPHLPHAVRADDGAGGHLHLHVASVVDGGRFTSGFGWRQHPMGGGGAHHEGLDIAAPTGTPVRAAGSGKVIEIGRRGAFGRMIRIRHSARLETVYAHLSGYARHLEVGQQVGQDEVIGSVGASGRATGSHLHIEFRRNGRAIDPLALTALPHGG